MVGEYLYHGSSTTDRTWVIPSSSMIKGSVAVYMSERKSLGKISLACGVNSLKCRGVHCLRSFHRGTGSLLEEWHVDEIAPSCVRILSVHCVTGSVLVAESTSATRQSDNDLLSEVRQN